MRRAVTLLLGWEHLLRDVGLGNLAIATVAVVALRNGSLRAARAVGLAVVVANLPHQLHHRAHVSELPTTADRVLQSVSPTVVSVTAVALVVLTSRPSPAAPSTTAHTDPGAPASPHR